ncbi:MAG: hypothetical protein ACKO96_33035 [Flammeovirgaceae bacterium]
MNFDWDSFLINIISDFVFFLVTIPLVIKYLPDIAIRLLKKRNKRHLATKFSSILIELCEFITDSQYRDNELNKEHLVITTKKKDLKYFKHVALCNINVFSKIVYPKTILVIHDYHKKLTIDESYKLMTEEYNRLKTFRTDIERILSAHSLLVDEEIVLKISNLCFDIRKKEMDFKINLMQDDLLQKLNAPRTGFLDWVNFIRYMNRFST